jgi:hypothetical protein
MLRQACYRVQRQLSCKAAARGGALCVFHCVLFCAAASAFLEARVQLLDIAMLALVLLLAAAAGELYQSVHA